MKLYDTKTGEPTEIPDDQVQAAYQSGDYGLPKGARIPVVREGQYGTVPSEELGDALGDGNTTIATPEEIHKADIEKKYGGLAGGIESGLEGFGRGVTLGGTDIAAPYIAQAFGGDPNAVREHIKGVREQHPYSAMGGEVAGILAPSLLSGGTAAPLEAGVIGADAARLGAEGVEAAKLANAAREASAVAKAAKIAAAPVKAVTGAGHLAEEAVAKLVGTNAENLLGRVGQKMLSKGAGSAVEGALFNVASEADEQSLGDAPLNGQKLWAATGHGLLLGATLGAGIGAGGELGKALVSKISGGNVAGKISESLDHAANEQAFRATNARKAFVSKANRIAGGSAGVGKRLLDEGLIAAGDTVEDISPKLSAARESAGQEIGNMLEAADAQGIAGPNIYRIEKSVQARLAELRMMPELNKGAIAKYESALRDLRGFAENKTAFKAPGSVYDIGLADSELTAPRANRAIDIAKLNDRVGLRDINAGIGETTEEALANHAGIGAEERPFKIDRTRPGHIGEGVTLHGEGEAENAAEHSPFSFSKDYQVGIKPGALTDEASAIRKPIGIAQNEPASDKLLADARKSYDKDLTLTFKEAHEFRTNLQNKINWEKAANPMAPVNETTEAMKAVRNAIEDELIETGEKGAQELGGSFEKEYKAAKLRYQQLALADDAAQDSINRVQANAGHSLTDKIAGAAGFAAGVAHGPLGALGGLAMGQASKIVRTQGNSTAAVLLQKMAALSGVEKATSVIDSEIRTGVKSIFEKEAPRIKPSIRVRKFSKNDNLKDEYDAQVRAVKSAVSQADTHADHIASHVAGLQEHAPNIAAAFQKSAILSTTYLASRIPQSHQDFSSLQPHLNKPRVSDTDMHNFLTENKAIQDPVHTIFSGVQNGTLKRTQVDAIKATSPDLLKQIQEQVRDSIYSSEERIPYSKAAQISILLDVPADKTFEPPFIKSMQGNFTPVQDNSSGSGSAPSAPKRQLGNVGSAGLLPGQQPK